MSDIAAINAALSAWYRPLVKTYAEAVVTEVRNGDFPNLEEALDSLSDVAPIIYTYQARLVCLASDNADAFEEETGESPETVEQRAFWALRADVAEYIARHELLPEEDTEVSTDE